MKLEINIDDESFDKAVVEYLKEGIYSTLYFSDIETARALYRVLHWHTPHSELDAIVAEIKHTISGSIRQPAPVELDYVFGEIE
jgi:hypothetical protein